MTPWYVLFPAVHDIQNLTKILANSILLYDQLVTKHVKNGTIWISVGYVITHQILIEPHLYFKMMKVYTYTVNRA